MAHATKAKPEQGNSEALTEASAAAAGNVLRAAAAAGAEPGNAGAAARITRLARMCDEAASHMAAAQTSLSEGMEGGESAIGHLDAALQCLYALADESERQKTGGSRAAKSA